MAISRREILKYGVSYGTGVINFNNDSIAYERELRKLYQDVSFNTFLEELEKAEENLLENNSIEEGLKVAQTNPESEATQTGQSTEAAPAQVNQSAEATPVQTDQETQDVQYAFPSPLNDVIEAAISFRELCALLALSELCIQMNEVIANLQKDCLPPAQDLQNIKDCYSGLLNYLESC